jgi:hypothetical protein
MKKEKLSHGDLFYLELPGKVYVKGRVLFDVNKQYHKLVDYDALPDSQKNYFYWYTVCQLVEIYKGVYSSVSQMKSSVGEVIIAGAFTVAIDSRHNKEVPFGKLGHIPVDYTQIEFPETLPFNDFEERVYLLRGEIRLLTQLPFSEGKQIDIRDTLEYPSLLGDACLFYQSRQDLIKRRVRNSYLTDSNLRYHPELRKRVYEEIGEDPTLSYYEFAKKRGFDLARFYEKR